MSRRLRERMAIAFGALLLGTVWLGTRRVETAGSMACENLSGLVLPNAAITSAQMVAAGAFSPPGAGRRGGAGGRGAATYQELPAFCRVAATLTPSSDSDIKIEVWLPASGWNRKFQAVGNGGWAGSISYSALADAVAAGYAGASTDTGHVGGTAEFALGHPEKIIDLAYRSHHEMAVKAKALIAAHYGSAPKVSFWNGCSQGGRQGLAAAQLYPADFDAIAAGAPAWNYGNLYAGRMAVHHLVTRKPESMIPATKYPMIHDAVVTACDRLDGVQDGIIENPGRCAFDPKVLQCRDADSPSCLTAAQVESARAMYAPVKHPTTGAVVYAGLPPGAELGWGVIAGPEPLGTVLEAFKYIVFSDRNWDWRRFNPATDIDRTVNALRPMATNDANLKGFFGRGGKLLLYHGWTDTQVAPEHTVTYFTNVVGRMGKSAVGKSVQLYMVPGMNHCQGGLGTDRFDKMAAMESWVAAGTAPARILASHLTGGTVDRSRPLCPYGQVAKWKGIGSTDDAANFACVAEGGRLQTR